MVRQYLSPRTEENHIRTQAEWREGRTEEAKRLAEELDDLLDEIDKILDEIPRDFAETYIQRGGQ